MAISSRYCPALCFCPNPTATTPSKLVNSARARASAAKNACGSERICVLFFPGGITGSYAQLQFARADALFFAQPGETIRDAVAIRARQHRQEVVAVTRERLGRRRVRTCRSAPSPVHRPD